MNNPGVQSDDNSGSNSADHNFFQCFQKKGLHFLHLNIRSLLPKLCDLRLLAERSLAAIIGLSETWLDSTVMDSEISMDNYIVYRQNRNREGGGVCIYIRSDLASNIRADFDHPNLETLWVDILLPKTKPIVIGIGYRPPRQISSTS